MSRIVRIVLVGMAVLWGASVSAAPRPEDKTIGPSVIGQAQSLDHMLKTARQMILVVGGEKLASAFDKEFLPQVDPKQLPGLDPKRPFGLYGTLDAEIAKCRGVLLVPITNQKDFLDMVEGFGIKITKGKEAGIYDLETPPDVPFPVSLKIHKEYAYIAIGGSDALDAKAIYDPNEVINDKEKALAMVAVRLDRIPKETKKFVLAALQEQAATLKEEAPAPELKEALNSLEKLYLRWLKLLFDEGKEIAIRLEADPKKGDLALELSVEGVSKSALADVFAKRQPTKNAFASLAGDDCVQRVFLTAPLFADEIKEVFAKLLEYGKREALSENQGAPAEVNKMIEAAFDSLRATVLSGEMDLAASFRGPTKEGYYNAIGAVHLKEAKNLEKAIKEAIKVVPEDKRKLVKLDAVKIGTQSVHQMDLSGEVDEIAKKLFGKGNIVHVVFGNDAVYVAYGPDGVALLKEAIEAKPKLASSLEIWADGKRSVELLKKVMPPEEAKNMPDEVKSMIEAMSKLQDASGISVKVTGGDKLRIRLNFGASSLAYFFMGFGTQVGGGLAPPAAKE